MKKKRNPLKDLFGSAKRLPGETTESILEKSKSQKANIQMKLLKNKRKD